jgi:hypothetical protein
VYDERYQPSPNFQTPAYPYPAYGELPCVHYSQRIQRQLEIPLGEPLLFGPGAPPHAPSGPPRESLPAPAPEP